MKEGLKGFVMIRVKRKNPPLLYDRKKNKFRHIEGGMLVKVARLSLRFFFKLFMPLKREVSTSVANLQQSVKRLALEEDILQANMTTPTYRTNIESVISTSRDDFDLIYERLDEIGRGGFSTVYRCKNKVTQEIYAVKVYSLSISTCLIILM